MPNSLEPGEIPMQHDRNTPFRHKRGGYRRKKGIWTALARAGGKEQLNIGCSALGLLAAIIYLLWRFVIGPMIAANAAPPPTPTPTPEPTLTPTAIVTPTPGMLLPQPLQPVQQFVTPTPNGSPTPTSIPSVPEVAPLGAGSVTVFGSVDFAGGCPVTNLAFVASGNLYYLLINGDLQFPDGNPQGQMAMIRGYTSEFEDCDAPLLSVASLRWLGVEEEATLSQKTSRGGVGTVVTASGTRMPSPTPTPTNTPRPTFTATAYPTAKPATSTPRPTFTATATPAPVSMTGAVLLADGCDTTNWIINATGDAYYLLMPAGLAIDFDPRNESRQAIVNGTNSRACNGNAISVSSLIWLTTPTPTATNTPTVTPTPTQTATPSATPTVTPTPTQTGTATPTATTGLTATATATATEEQSPTATATPEPTNTTGPEPTPVPL